MESLLVLFVYNRDKILKKCIETLFNNTSYKFDEILLINDGSTPEVTKNLMQFCLQNHNVEQPQFTLLNFGKNQGYGYTAEIAFNYMRWRNPKYVFFIEQDYIFRADWAKEATDVLKARSKTIAISGYCNPDFFNKEKTDVIFPQIIKDDFGSDPCKREFMYKPFDLETESGLIEVQGSSNSCGMSILNWQWIKFFSEKFPDFWKKVIERSCNKQPGGNRRYFGDGPFSHGLSWYWYQYYNENKDEVDFSKDFPWLDICDFSISSHKNGMGLNGMIAPEGQTFVESPRWREEFLNGNPRLCGKL